MILLKETTQEFDTATRRLRTYRIDSDEAMIALHEEMTTDVDIVTQIERSEVINGELHSITYVITQKVTVKPPKEDEALKGKKK